jgi:hypothetical protein
MKENEDSIVEQPSNPPQKDIEVAWEAQLRKWVTWVGLGGTALFMGYFLLFMSFQATWGKCEPTNWVAELAKKTFPSFGWYSAVGGCSFLHRFNPQGYKRSNSH